MNHFLSFQLQSEAAAGVGATAQWLWTSQMSGASQEPAAGGTDVSLCFSALASFHTPHHMESGRQAASLDSRLPLLSVFCLFFFYLLFNHSGGLTVSQFTVYGTFSCFNPLFDYFSVSFWPTRFHISIRVFQGSSWLLIGLFLYWPLQHIASDGRWVTVPRVGQLFYAAFVLWWWIILLWIRLSFE